MTTTEIHSFATIRAALRPAGLLAHLWQAFIRWLTEPCADPDPTTSFTPRDWADLPVHHPQSEER